MKVKKQNTLTSYTYSHNRFTAYVDIDEYLRKAKVDIPNLVYGWIKVDWKSGNLRTVADIFNKVADELDKLPKQD